MEDWTKNSLFNTFLLMDLQTAQRLSGRRWQVAKLAALLCFAVACGLLISSLAASSGFGAEADPSPRSIASTGH